MRYTVGAAPIITLNEPSDGERFNEGEDVTFEATVLDNADSPLDLTIVWESNWDGVLDTFGADGSGSTTFTTSR